MFSSQEPDPAPRSEDRRKWDYVSVPNGGSIVGYLAGYPFGVHTHHVGHTKPCKRRMTHSALVCPFCEGGLAPVWRGYTPIYDREYLPRYVLITQDYLESVREIPVHAQVRISRAKPEKSPPIIRPELWTPKALPLGHGRDREPDLLPSLLRTWKDDELKRWCLSQTPALPQTETPKPTLVERPEDVIGGDVGRKVLEKLLKLEGHNGRGDAEPKPIGELVGPPHQNGKPRKPK